MATSFGATSSARAQALREIHEGHAELIRREYQDSFNVPRESLGRSADATCYGTISPRAAARASSELMAQAARSISSFHRFGEERDMPVSTRTYLGICCSLECAEAKMDAIKRRRPDAAVYNISLSIVIDGERIQFFIDPNSGRYRWEGLEIYSYRVCGHYILDIGTEACLRTRIRQR